MSKPSSPSSPSSPPPEDLQKPFISGSYSAAKEKEKEESTEWKCEDSPTDKAIGATSSPCEKPLTAESLIGAVNKPIVSFSESLPSISCDSERLHKYRTPTPYRSTYDPSPKSSNDKSKSLLSDSSNINENFGDKQLDSARRVLFHDEKRQSTGRRYSN